MEHHILCNRRWSAGGDCTCPTQPESPARLNREARATLLRENGPTIGLSPQPDPVIERLDRLLLEVLLMKAAMEFQWGINQPHLDSRLRTSEPDGRG